MRLPIAKPCSDCRCKPGFTLIELLVVISILAVLISILLPALAGARESSRNALCLTRLRGLGVGLQLYMNDGDDLLPYLEPIHDENNNDESLLSVLADYVDVPTPVRDEEVSPVTGDPYWQVNDAFRCPSDRAGAIDTDDDPEPLWRQVGTSYEYGPGRAMFALDVFVSDGGLDLEDVQQSLRTVITTLYRDPARAYWPVLYDFADFHPRSGEGSRNLLAFTDGSVSSGELPTGIEASEFLTEAIDRLTP